MPSPRVDAAVAAVAAALALGACQPIVHPPVPPGVGSRPVRVMRHHPGAMLPVVACDWDGDGRDTPATFSEGRWRLADANGHAFTEEGVRFGRSQDDVPLCGDWDGNGSDEVGVYRAGEGFHLRAHNGARAPTARAALGGGTDAVPVVGDWDGDGRDTPGLFRRGVWTLSDDPAGGGSLRKVVFGQSPGDRPVVGDWDGDGRDTVGVVRGAEWHTADDAGREAVRFLDDALGGNPLVIRQGPVDVAMVARHNPGRPDPVEVHYYGDSLSHEAQAWFAAELRGRRRPVSLRYQSGIGTAVCDWIERVVAEARSQPDLIVMAFAGNPGVHCGPRAHHGARYGEYLHGARDVMRRTGSVPVLWVIPPAFGAGDYVRGGGEVAAAYEQVAREFPGRAFLADARPLLSPTGTFQTTMPCLPSEPCVGPTAGGFRSNVVRAPDLVHLCPEDRPESNWYACQIHSSGAHRFAAAIARPIVIRFRL